MQDDETLKSELWHPFLRITDHNKCKINKHENATWQRVIKRMPLFERLEKTC